MADQHKSHLSQFCDVHIFRACIRPCLLQLECDSGASCTLLARQPPLDRSTLTCSRHSLQERHLDADPHDWETRACRAAAGIPIYLDICIVSTARLEHGHWQVRRSCVLKRALVRSKRADGQMAPQAVHNGWMVPIATKSQER